MIELKRCPFCGDEVEIVPTGLYHWKYAIHHKSKTECILDANAFAVPYEEEDAIRMWNTRADRKTESNSEKPNNCEDFFREPTAEERKAVADYIDSISVPTGVNVFDFMDEPTVSKMEQVDKDINVPSKDEPTWEQVKEYCNKRCLDIVDSAMRKQWYKDEPQTSCKTCRFGEMDEGYVRCAYYSKATEQDEPQTDWHYDEQDATWYPYKHEDEPQQKSCATCKHALGNWDGESNNCGRCCGADRRFYEPKDEPQTDCAWK